MPAAEMHRMAPAEVFQPERRDRNELGLELGERGAQSREVGGVGENGQVCIAAKLGCAVEHAGLTAHEEGADAVLLNRRKDFAYRVRDQVSLQARDKPARASRFPASVPTA